MLVLGIAGIAIAIPIIFEVGSMGVMILDNLQLNPVPEPATMLLLGTGLICLAGFGRKKFFKK